MLATLCLADGTVQEVTPKNGKRFTFDELYELIGCDMLEIIKTGDASMVLIGDENARLHDDYIINDQTTKIYRDSFGITDPQAQWDAFVKDAEARGVMVIENRRHDEEPYTMAGNMVYCPAMMV